MTRGVGIQRVSKLALKLLGPPVLEADGHLVEIGRRKALALLAYLTATQQPHSRDALATLFWPGCGQSKARANLRTALSTLHQALGEGLLVTEQETVKLVPGQRLWDDLRQFYSLLEGCPAHTRPASTGCPECLSMLEQAAALYRNDFLFGFSLPDCRDFDEWQFMQAERLRAELSSALRSLAEGCAADGLLEQAIGHARRWLALDPLEEAAHRELMRLYVANGQQAAALRQYRACVRVMHEELDTEPEPETAELGKAIERKQLKSNRDTKASRGTQTTGDSDPGGELRLVTILVAGASSVVDQEWEERPEETTSKVAPLLEMMERVLADHGALLQHNLGDDVLAAFGIPVSREDDAERAIRAALTVQSLASELNLSVAVGIDTGTVFATGQTVLGAAVNRASRLRYQNSGGQILVTGSTRRRTRGVFEFAPCPVNWPGRVQAETVYRVTVLKREPEKPYGIDGLHAKLIGRDEELHLLQSVVARTLEGQGQIVTLVGEAGVGKSRLVRELREQPLPGDRMPEICWLYGRCQELGGTAGYTPFLEILRGFFGLSPLESMSARAGRLQAGLQELALAGNLISEQLEEIGPLLGHLLSVQFRTSWDQSLAVLGSRQVQQRTFQALSILFSAIARTRPTALVLEDLHWADNLSLDLVALLMETLAVQPLLVLCIYRPELGHKCWKLSSIAARQCPERHTEIRLRELDLPHSRNLVQSLLGMQGLPMPLERMVMQRGRGNPLFIEEILRTLIDAGAVVREQGGWGWHEAELPETVPENIWVLTQGRVDRLQREDKLVLQSAAAIGVVFGLAVLERINPPGTAIGKALQELESAELVYEERSFPEQEYAFRHALLQEAVYQSVPKKRREDLHRRIGTAMEKLFADRLEERCEQIAFHFEHGGLPEKAVEFLLHSGDKALRRFQNDQAVLYYQRALDLLAAAGLAESRKEQRLRALTGLGRAFFILQQGEDMERCYSQALDLSAALGRSSREQIPLYYGLGLSLTNLGRDEEAARIAAKGLELLGQRTDSEEAVQMNLVLAYSHCRLDSARSSRISLGLARFIDRLGYKEEIGLAQICIAQGCYVSRQGQEAREWYARTRRQAESHSDLVTLAELHKSTAWYAFLRGDLRAAIADHVASVEVCRRLGDNADICISWLQMGWFFEFLGDLESAWQYDQRVLEQVDQLERFFLVEIVRADLARNLSTALFAKKSVAEALFHLNQALEIYWSSVEDLQHPFTKAINIALVAKALLAQGIKIEAKRILFRLFECAPHRVPQHIYQSRVGMALALSGLEAALEDPAAFADFCRAYRGKFPEVEESPFQHWYLETANPRNPGRELVREGFEGLLSADWSWLDPGGDGSYRLAAGLEIQAANGRDLWHLNVSAPRLLRSFTGSFIVQAVCEPALADRPVMGGLALWQDDRNFLHLELGSLGRHELTFKGCLDGKDTLLGRGRLIAEKVFLRLERIDNRVRALCSSDGLAWYRVGETTAQFAAEIQVALYACGWIDRSYYHGPFPHGAAIRFESFTAWQLPGNQSATRRKA